jgi:hypothetical protein
MKCINSCKVTTRNEPIYYCLNKGELPSPGWRDVREKIEEWLLTLSNTPGWSDVGKIMMEMRGILELLPAPPEGVQR